MRSILFFLSVVFSLTVNAQFLNNDALLKSNLANSYDLVQFHVNYNTTDYSYLASAGFSDTGSFPSGANVIRVETIVADGSNWGTSAYYMYADDPANDKIAFTKNIGGTQTTEILNLDWTVFDSFSPGAQGMSYDPVNEWFYLYSDITDNFNVTDNTGATVATISAIDVPGSSSTKFHYDYRNDLMYVSPSAGDSRLQVWARSGGAFALSSTKWYGGTEGVVLDNIFDKVLMFENGSARVRQQNISGKDGIIIHQWPNSVNLNTEGLTMLPDGTFVLASPSNYHQAIVNGNRMWWWDPRAVYKKYERSPTMTRFGTHFTGGVLTGDGEFEHITQNVGSKIYSAVYDTDGFTNTENASAWAFEFSAGGDADVTWITSASAPTTTPTTSYFSDMPAYPGWGATTPSAEAGTPGTDRYKQAVLEVKHATPSTAITIDNILTQLGSKCKILFYEGDSEYMYVSPDVTTRLMVNQANTSGNFSATSNLFNYSSASSYLQDPGGTNLLSGSTSLVSSDQQGQLTIFGVKDIATTPAVHLAGAVSSTNNNRLMMMQRQSTSGALQNRYYIEHTDNAGTLNQVAATTADASLTFKRIDYVSTGSAWKIYVNNVDQALTVVSGSNTGAWFGDLTGFNRFSTGAAQSASTQNGQHKRRLLIYCNDLLTVDDSALIDQFATQEGLL